MAKVSYHNHRPNNFKILFVGDSGVGKTSLFKLFETHEVVRDLDLQLTCNIIIAFQNITLPKGNHEVQLNIHDTPGNFDQFKAIMPQFYRGADIVILTYDITQQRSFDSVTTTWIEEVRRHCNNDRMRILLIGNKVDLDAKRKVSFDDANTFLRNNNDIEMFFETSAKNRGHYTKLYDAIVTTTANIMAEGGPYAARREQEGGTVHLNNVAAQEDQEPLVAPRRGKCCGR